MRPINKKLTFTLGASLLLTLSVGCETLDKRQPTSAAATPVRVELLASQTAEGVGAGQGVEVRDGFVYLYGDAETGVIRQYTFDPTKPAIEYTGVEIKLTQHGVDVASHPTGLTHHPRYGTFLGDTVNRKGRIFVIDWEIALRDRNLDNAILNVVEDDLGVNGTRPEFVELSDGRWVIATSDYGDRDNAVRFYDPERLLRIDRTSATGVLIREHRCDPFVQTLYWMAEPRLLVLVQNQIAGLRWRLTFVDIDARDDYRGAPRFDDFEPVDELEGFHTLPGGWCIGFSAMRETNVWLGRVTLVD